MFGSEILDVAIGLVFVYFLLSLLCLTITELLARVFAMRASTLEQALRNLLSEQGSSLVEEFYNHPLIKKLALQDAGHGIGQGNGKPSYISASAFSLVVLDLITKQRGAAPAPQTVEEVRTAVAASGYQELGKLLLSVIGYDTADLEQARKNIEQYYDELMGRVEGWYKRKTQVIVLVLSLILAALLNADTLTMAETLSSDAALRNTIVEEAIKAIIAQPEQQSPDTGSVEQALTLWEKLDQLNLPLGWIAADPNIQDPRELPVLPVDWADKVLGLLITGLLVSLGSPFWFDALGKLVNIRAVGRQLEKTGEESGTSKLLLPGDGTFVALPTKPATPGAGPQAPAQPSVEAQLAQLAAESVVYVRQLQARGQLRLPEADVAAAWVVTKVHDLGLGSEVTDSQIVAAVRTALG